MRQKYPENIIKRQVKKSTKHENSLIFCQLRANPRLSYREHLLTHSTKTVKNVFLQIQQEIFYLRKTLVFMQLLKNPCCRPEIDSQD